MMAADKSKPKDTCCICRTRREVGICEFGAGPMKAGPHCRSCCTNPIRDKWRPATPREMAAERDLRKVGS